MHRRIRPFLATSVAALLVGTTAATAGPSGAIFTTNVDGSWVNGNVYDAKEEVYLNGGPRANQNCSAAGLPDGDYYFQVTDPSGKVLLSTDVLGERRIHVGDGSIDNYLGSTHLPPPPFPPAAYGRCSALMIPLVPFLDTPNPGGEYKVWLTPVAEGNDACDGHLSCAELFLPSNSKTDNFKVQTPDGGSPD